MNQDFYRLEDNSAKEEQAQMKADKQEIKELQYLAQKCGVKY